MLAADNGLGPVLLDLWDTDIAPALLPLYKQYELDTPVLPSMISPAPVAWFYPAPPPSARAVRRTVAEFRTTLPRWLDRSLSSRPLVYVSLGTLTTAMTDLRTVVGSAYREIMAALSAIDCDAIVSAGNLAEHLRSTDPRIKVVEHVPQPAHLRHADLFVTHGGRASLLDAVQGTTPLLVMGVLADQPDNAAAFPRRCLGRTLGAAPFLCRRRPVCPNGVPPPGCGCRSWPSGSGSSAAAGARVGPRGPQQGGLGRGERAMAKSDVVLIESPLPVEQDSHAVLVVGAHRPAPDVALKRPFVVAQAARSDLAGRHPGPIRREQVFQ
ncbi:MULTISPECIES: hypothetical protein [unclassified Streptomyces]|uniref:glycosyltransferase n=1 Tax=unclassified Streptomyces TaxID=2593676 RepID=UPI002F91AF7D